jgi:hypothetical protein
VTHVNCKSGFVILVVGLLSSMFSASPAVAQVDASFCGPLDNGFGPFDYRPDRDPPTVGTGDHTYKLGLVEGAHFTKDVELLIRGHRSGVDPGGDIDYTLRAFPNHHPALMAVMRYGEKKASQKPAGLKYVVECYFERAIRFRSDDAIVRMIYATYLAKNKRTPEAIAQLELATRIAGDNAFTHYNIGLVYFDLKMYDKALVQAHRAMNLGFARTQLREQLESAGQWQEPGGVPAVGAVSAPQ